MMSWSSILTNYHNSWNTFYTERGVVYLRHIYKDASSFCFAACKAKAFKPVTNSCILLVLTTNRLKLICCLVYQVSYTYFHIVTSYV